MSDISSQLNRQSPLALYYQLKHILISEIDNGKYLEGDQLPSESEFTRKYKVSRHVVRQALKALVAEGRIRSKQGSGYFVNQKRIRKALPRLSSHTEGMSKLGRNTKTVVTHQDIVTPPHVIAKRLLSPGETQAILIERVSYLDDEPVCLIFAYYPLKFSNALMNVELDNRSIYALLRKSHSIEPARAETVISVTFADENQSSLLSIPEGMPLLSIGSFSWSKDNDLFEYSSGRYRIDRFELEIEQV